MRIAYLPDDIRIIGLVAGWLHAEFSQRGRGSTSLQARVQRIRRRAKRRAIPLGFIGSEAGVVVGTASLVAHDMESRLDLTPWLASVYVEPDYRRRGIGAELSQRVVQEARKFGFGRTYLFTYDKEDFYGALGWKGIQRTEYHRESVTVMALG